MIRHDREPGFMSDFFRIFIKIAGENQRAAMDYRPQENSTAERMVQTLIESSRCMSQMWIKRIGMSTLRD